MVQRKRTAVLQPANNAQRASLHDAASRNSLFPTPPPLTPPSSLYVTPSSSSTTLRINVLPMFDVERELENPFVVEIDADSSLCDLKCRIKKQVSQNLAVGAAVSVIGLFVARSNDPSSPFLPLDSVASTSIATISDLYVRRENCLRLETTMASCVTAPDCVSVVALVTDPGRHDTKGRKAMDDASPEEATIFETFLDSEIVDGKLPRTLTGLDSGLFVRDDYVKLFRVIRERLVGFRAELEEERRAQDPKNAARATFKAKSKRQTATKNTVLVTGTPGVGKSAFLGFLLHQLSRTRPVVFDDGKTIVLVRPDGTITVGSLKRFTKELKRANTVYLMDARRREPPPLTMMASTIIVTSPVPHVINSYIKSGMTKMETLIMPLWTLDELKECRAKCYASSATSASVTELFRYFGGVARHTLIAKTDMKAKIESIKAAIDMLSSQRVDANLDAAGQRGAFDDKDGFICHRLLHLATSNYETTVLVFASKFACDQLVQKNAQFVRKTLRKLLSASAHEPMIATARGHLFESYAHHLLEAGGMFTVKKLAPGCATTATSELALPPADRRVFDQVRLIPTDENVYAVPRAKNFPAFDAIVLPNKLFQMTVSLNHKVLHQAAEDVCDTLASILPVKKQRTRATQKKQTPPRFELYFVVPDDKFSDFKYQDYITSKKTTTKRPSVPIDQYALRIDL